MNSKFRCKLLCTVPKCAFKFISKISYKVQTLQGSKILFVWVPRRIFMKITNNNYLVHWLQGNNLSSTQNFIYNNLFSIPIYHKIS